MQERLQKIIARAGIVRFAGIGLAVTAIIYATLALVPYSENPPRAMMMLSVVSVVLCPPSLMSVSPLTIYEPPFWVGSLVLWPIIGHINAGLYKAIGAVAGRYVWKAARSTTS
jgi:hypothetical protein